MFYKNVVFKNLEVSLSIYHLIVSIFNFLLYMIENSEEETLNEKTEGS